MKPTLSIRLRHLTAAVMTWLTSASLYILRTVLLFISVPAAAVSNYHAVPLLMEHVLVGIAVYAAFLLLYLKIQSESPYVRPGSGKH